MCFQKYVWGLKSPSLTFEMFYGEHLAFCQYSLYFRRSILPVFLKVIEFSVARSFFYIFFSRGGKEFPGVIYFILFSLFFFQ